MSPIHETEQARPQYRRLLRGPMIVLALVIIVRFVLEAAGVSLDTTRFLSASVVSGLAIIYVGAVAPLRGVTKFRQLALPALVLSAWLGGWTALALIISGVFRLPGSHFAHAPPEPLYPNFGFHVVEHIAVIPIASLVTVGVMAIPYFLHRWPVTVAPASVLGGLVTLRFAAEAMNLAPTNDCRGMELQRRPTAERPLSRRHRTANGSPLPPATPGSGIRFGLGLAVMDLPGGTRERRLTL